VTLPTGTRAIAILTAQMFGSTGQTAAFMSVSVTGATTILGSDANSYRVFGNDPIRASAVVLLTLNAGSNTFCAVYRQVGSGSSTFSVRTITVIPG
jgi:hypothetical protein